MLVNDSHQAFTRNHEHFCRKVIYAAVKDTGSDSELSSNLTPLTDCLVFSNTDSVSLCFLTWEVVDE